MEAQDVLFDEPVEVEAAKAAVPVEQTTAVAMREENVPTAPTRASGAMTPFEMLNAAIERGDSLDKLERLMGLNDRWEAAQAKKAFIEAKAAFKANAPTIYKDKTNTQYKSKYASIDNVVNTLNAAMAPYGLDADWDFDQSDRIKVTCTLTHVAGHQESRSLFGPPDTSGAKNPLQQIKSTLTYLKLATYEAVTGIATKEGNADDDGNSACGADPLATITAEQQEEIRTLLKESNSDTGRFLEFAKSETVSDILAKDFKQLKAMLVAKKKGKAS